MRSLWHDFLAAVQFLTRVPVPAGSWTSHPRAIKFFPLVGLLVGAAGALVERSLALHLPRLVAAVFTVAFLVLLTGSLHEDGLADAADGLGGGWTRDRVLVIMRDSRIGTYGAAALILSLVGRITLIAALPAANVARVLIAAHILCRWTTLPLSYFLPSARSEEDGLGAQVAKLTNLPTLLFGTVSTFVCAINLLRMRSVAAILAAVAISLLSGLYYRRRIQGVTGDCFGATNQLTEVAVYLCGVWIA